MSKEERFLNNCFLAHLSKNNIGQAKGVSSIGIFIMNMLMDSAMRRLMEFERDIFK